MTPPPLVIYSGGGKTSVKTSKAYLLKAITQSQYWVKVNIQDHFWKLEDRTFHLWHQE